MDPTRRRSTNQKTTPGRVGSSTPVPRLPVSPLDFPLLSFLRHLSSFIPLPLPFLLCTLPPIRRFVLGLFPHLSLPCADEMRVEPSLSFTSTLLSSVSICPRGKSSPGSFLTRMRCGSMWMAKDSEHEKTNSQRYSARKSTFERAQAQICESRIGFHSATGGICSVFGSF